MELFDKDPVSILNYCAKYLARGNRYIDAPAGPANPNLMTSSEVWRFPILESYIDTTNQNSETQGLDYTQNIVTFVYVTPENPDDYQVEIIGDFGPLHEAIPLKPVQYLGESTIYHAVTMLLPVGHLYHYLFRVNGELKLDPINPQTATLANGKTWSQFFTDFYTSPVSFEEWEMRLLYRLTSHILPFETPDGENFIKRTYESLPPDQKLAARVYEMDVSVGEASYIDNLVTRTERQYLDDYKSCLQIIDKVLRKRNPYVESWDVSKETIVDLYHDMASGTVDGWDYGAYSNPRFFLTLLRRHCVIGAFSHPKYGGNVAAIGWRYLQDRYQDSGGQTLFDWEAALEQPIGRNTNYLG
jgi:hypothetical protein